MQKENVDLQKAIGQVIRTVRIRKGFKFTLFCYEHGIPTTTLYMLEQGSSNTRAANLYYVVQALGLSFAEFGALVDKQLVENA